MYAHTHKHKTDAYHILSYDGTGNDNIKFFCLPPMRKNHW